jgi:hypothetical protein
MNSTTSRRSRYSVRAAVVFTAAAVVLGAAACGTETASDSDKSGGVPAHGAPGAVFQQAPHFPTSADAQERRAWAEQQEQYRRHLLGASADDRRQPVKVRRSASGDERRQPVTSR